MKKPTAPCKACDDRTTVCHTYCKKYEEFSKEQEEYRKLTRKASKFRYMFGIRN